MRWSTFTISFRRSSESGGTGTRTTPLSTDGLSPMSAVCMARLMSSAMFWS